MILFTVFGIPLTRYGVGCMFALLVGLCVTGIVIARQGLGYGKFIRLAVCVIPLTWLFSRLIWLSQDLISLGVGYVMDIEMDIDPIEALRFWHGGYSLMGAVIGAILGAKIAEGVTHSLRGSLRDAMALGLPAAILVERLAEHGTGLGLGRAVSASWLANLRICPIIDGEAVHPVYLYEAAAALVIFILLIIWAAKKKPLMKRFLLCFGLSQVILESLRADGHMVQHFVHVQQIIAIAFAVFALIGWSREAVTRPGRHTALAVGWLLTVAAIAVGVLAEFGVDRWGKPLLAYGVMAACMVVIAVVAADFARMAER